MPKVVPLNYKNTLSNKMLKIILGNHPEMFSDDYARLAVQILNQSLTDLKDPKYKDEAIEFFTSKDKTYEFSFLNICDNLDIRPQKFLDAIKQYYGIKF